MKLSEIEQLEKAIRRERDELMRDERINHHVERTNKRTQLIKSRKNLIETLENNLTALKLSLKIQKF